MGLISIQTKGSFGESYKNFSAQENGHAHAVNKAMIYLNDLMRRAINNDHKCHDEGLKPDDGFRVE